MEKKMILVMIGQYEVCRFQLIPKSIQKIRTLSQVFMKERKLIEELL